MATSCRRQPQLPGRNWAAGRVATPARDLAHSLEILTEEDDPKNMPFLFEGQGFGWKGAAALNETADLVPNGPDVDKQLVAPTPAKRFGRIDRPALASRCE